MEVLIGLIGVIIVSIIGYVAVITTLVVEHRRWRKEFKLQYLIKERIRQEEQCDRMKEILEESVNKGSYSTELVVRWIRLPEKVKSRIRKAWKEIDHSNDKGRRKLYEEASLILETYLGKVDKQIEELTQ